MHVKGRGFTWKSENIDEDIRIAREAWDFAKEKILSENYRMIVLDELTYLMTYGMVGEDDVVDFLKNRPPAIHVVVTGRGAPQSLIDAADLVTEMKEIKHYFNTQNLEAREGIEY